MLSIDEKSLRNRDSPWGVMSLYEFVKQKNNPSWTSASNLNANLARLR